MDRVDRILSLYLEQLPEPKPVQAVPTDLAQYTSMLKEKGDAEGVVPQHSETMVQETPPVWKATTTYRDIQGAGEEKSKKEARHRASREAYMMLNR